MLGLVAALLLLPALPYAVASGSITIGTDAKWYSPGSVVTINGTSSTGVGVNVKITVNNTQGTVYQTTVQTTTGGKYKTTLSLDTDAYIGVYKAGANDGTNKAMITFTVSEVTPTVLANNMIKLAEDCQTRVEKRFEQLVAEGATISSEAEEHYDDGVAALTNAKHLLSDDHPVEALAAARSAMSDFRNAIWEAHKALKIDKIEDNLVDALNATIRREYRIVDKLNDVVTQLEKDGKDVVAAKAALVNAEKHLDNAAIALKANNLEEVKDLIEAAKVDLATAIDALKPLASNLAREAMLKFLNGAQMRVQNLEAQLHKFRTQGNKNRVDFALGELEMAKGKINEAIAALKNGRDLDSLKGFASANYHIKNGIGNFDSDKMSANLSNVNMLQAKIQFLERTMERMKSWNMNTDAIKAQIDGLQAQLDAAQQTPP